MPDLRTALLDLLRQLEGTAVQLIVGGGFGLFLRMERVRQLGVRTLLREWPEARSTNDLDLFLRAELLIHAAQLQPLRAALKALGYEPVPEARFYQFVRPGPQGAAGIKIDLLTGPRERFTGTAVRTDARRAHPHPRVGLHAHPVDEAPTLEEALAVHRISGRLSTGEPWEGQVLLPHAFPFLMMKLFAFRDRLTDGNKEFGRYHALDLYAILATTTEEEWEQALRFGEQLAANRYVIEAGELVRRYFGGQDHVGVVRLRESRYYRPEMESEDFASALAEVFPVRGGAQSPPRGG
ncbi:MAG: hypothetical protein AB1505_29185 [Candidatus Latescibacterota bacterium]